MSYRFNLVHVIVDRRSGCVVAVFTDVEKLVEWANKINADTVAWREIHVYEANRASVTRSPGPVEVFPLTDVIGRSAGPTGGK